MTELGWLLVGLAILLLAMVSSAVKEVLPPRCATCNRRYNHRDHDQCPYCVPLRKPDVTEYGLPFFMSLGIGFIGYIMQDGWIIGMSVFLFLLCLVGTQARIPQGEYSWRVLGLAIILFLAAWFIASTFEAAKIGR